MYTIRLNRAIILKIKKQIFLTALMLFSSLFSAHNCFPSYSQAQAQDTNSPSNTSSFQSKASIIDNMPFQKVTIGDIEIAYKQLGKSGAKPIVLITGLGATMDMWNPLLLEQLTSSNYSVTIFDNRGAGESTAGTKEFSINQFANDTADLLDALNITQADVLGFSMGSFIAQELTLANPGKVDKLILYASICGGNESKPASPEVNQAFSNPAKSPQEHMQKTIPLLFPTNWFKANPNYTNYLPIPKELVSLDVIGNQTKAAVNWAQEDNCNTISNITQPTLIIVGSDDLFTQAANSLILAQRISGSWLIQIGNAGHGLMYQYPDAFNRLILTFLETNNR
jgi:pimeloyl-ACP methyl ester carboxylesterase